MPLKSDCEDSKGECNHSNHRFDKTDSPCSRCRKISPLLSLSNHVLQLERKHPLQIDVLSLKRPLKVADRGSKCGAIVAVIACCTALVAAVAEALRDSDRVNDGLIHTTSLSVHRYMGQLR